MADKKTAADRLEAAGFTPEAKAPDAFEQEFGASVSSKAVNKSVRFLKAEDLSTPKAFRFEGHTFEDIEGKEGKPAKKLAFWTLIDRAGQRFSLSESHQLQKMRVKAEIKPGDYVSLHFEGTGKTKLGSVNLWGIKVLPAAEVPEGKRF